MSFTDVFEVRGRVFRLSMDVADKQMSADIYQQEDCFEDWVHIKKFLPIQNAKIANGKTSKQAKRMLDWATQVESVLGIGGVYSRIHMWIKMAGRV